MSRPPLSRLRRRFAPLRGTQRRCAALRAAPPGRYAPRALRAQAFWEHEKNANILLSGERKEAAFERRACFTRHVIAGRVTSATIWASLSRTCSLFTVMFPHMRQLAAYFAMQLFASG